MQYHVLYSYYKKNFIVQKDRSSELDLELEHQQQGYIKADIMDNWQITVIGMSGGGSKSISVATNEEDFLATTIEELMELVLKPWEGDFGDIENMRLIFIGKQLEKTSGRRVMTVEDYDIQRNSIIQVVTRVPGGQDATHHGDFAFPRPRTPTKDRVHVEGKTTLSISTAAADVDVIYGYNEDDKVPRAKMSCGHFVDPTKLFMLCRTLLDSKKSEFHCPVKECKKVWEYSQVRHAALLTLEECRYFESKLSQNVMRRTLDLKSCPRCYMTCERKERSVIITNCPACTKKLSRCYEFCWQCGKEWTGPQSTTAKKCGRPDCEHPSLPAVRNAVMISKYECMFPNIRACPTCGTLAEHTAEKCKFVICPQCKIPYCFLCLRTESECLKTKGMSWFTTCSVPVAPKQTKIPRWCK